MRDISAWGFLQWRLNHANALHTAHCIGKPAIFCDAEELDFVPLSHPNSARKGLGLPDQRYQFGELQIYCGFQEFRRLYAFEIG
jgi:hypothetical protein